MLLPGIPSDVADSVAGRERETPDGGREKYVKAHAALTAGTVYKVSHSATGPVTAAIADGAVFYQVIVPERDVASGEYFWGKIRGFVADAVVPSDTYIALEGLKVDNGAVVGTNAAYAYSDAEFAYVITAVAVAAKAADIYLVGREILATT